MAGFSPGRRVAEPDQQPLVSEGIEGERARGCGVQLMRSDDVEWPHVMLPHTES